MSEDLEMLEKLAQKIGWPLKKLDEIDKYSVGYQINTENKVIGLGLYQCNLKAFPVEILAFSQLQSLYLRSNKRTELPESLGQLSQLQALNLEWNELTKLPESLGQLSQLQKLYLEENKLTKLPESLGQLSQLQTLNLEHNKLTELPESLGQLSQLQTLDLGNNKLTELPKSLGQLSQLQTLGLNSNKLTELPEWLGQLSQLKTLNLWKNQLTKLPESLGQLSQLRGLYVRESKLTQLPNWLGQLSQLQTLDLGYNELTKLPESLGQLAQLQSLDLGGNQLTHFPAFLLDLGLKIKWDSDVLLVFLFEGIFVKDNPFTHPPLEIMQQGDTAIRDFFAAEEKVPLQECKLVLVGDGAAGKTSLLKQLNNETFNAHEAQTHGIYIKPFQLQNSDVTLYGWDFGGQHIMHATHQLFLSKRSLYLLVLDGRRDQKPSYWLQHINTFAQSAPVIIVINKIDENAFDLKQAEYKEKYPNILAFCKVSCKTGQGLEDLQEEIRKALPNIELINTPFPAAWRKVKQAIAEQQKNYTSYDHYIELCHHHKIQKESEQQTLIQFLHDLGWVLHFAEKGLRDTNVINPKWVTEAIYTLITNTEIAKQQGRLELHQLKTLLNIQIYPTHKHDYIFDLMKKFEIGYAINEETLLLPDLFPKNPPDFNFNKTAALHFVLQYNFLPRSLFNRLIIRLHKDIQAYWHEGIVLEYQGTKALIELSENQLLIYIHGAKSYLTIIRFVLLDITKAYHQLKVTEKIGLPEHPEIQVDYDYLQTLFTEDGQKTYRPPENPKLAFNIAELIDIPQIPTNHHEEIMHMLETILNILVARGIEDEKTFLQQVEEAIEAKIGLGGVSIDVKAIAKAVFKRR